MSAPHPRRGASPGGGQHGRFSSQVFGQGMAWGRVVLGAATWTATTVGLVSVVVLTEEYLQRRQEGGSVVWPVAARLKSSWCERRLPAGPAQALLRVLRPPDQDGRAAADAHTSQANQRTLPGSTARRFPAAWALRSWHAASWPGSAGGLCRLGPH